MAGLVFACETYSPDQLLGGQHIGRVEEETSLDEAEKIGARVLIWCNGSLDPASKASFAEPQIRHYWVEDLVQTGERRLRRSRYYR